jgi:alpha-mannosidase
MRFALEHQNPLVAASVTSGPAVSEPVYPATEYSLLQISDPNVLLWALKPAEEGSEKGTIARVWNLADRLVNCRLSIQGGLLEARRVTHIETDLNPVDLEKGHLPVRAAANQFLTYRLFLNAGRQ